ncbi:hypothetical protein EXIGLDRAFT_57238 [Exidia glandulosa HHB12029]|uniref:Uncharacterized protein n=1 Tax=Exidia glandulosa HHB12029 TaxID=1314781 RepID=A0A165I878_EXIGL|nr:hypothetical protein EXIGLDRAFT_57238 [Exidia glandulosa HHB12029]
MQHVPRASVATPVRMRDPLAEEAAYVPADADEVIQGIVSPPSPLSNPHTLQVSSKPHTNAGATPQRHAHKRARPRSRRATARIVNAGTRRGARTARRIAKKKSKSVSAWIEDGDDRLHHPHLQPQPDERTLDAGMGTAKQTETGRSRSRAL